MRDFRMDAEGWSGHYTQPKKNLTIVQLSAKIPERCLDNFGSQGLQVELLGRGLG